MGGDMESAIAPTFAALEAFAGELGTVCDGTTPIPGLEWTAEDLGRHVLAGERFYAQSAESAISGWRDLTQGPAENARLMEELVPERGLEEITAAMHEAASRLHDAWSEHPPGDLIPWHADLRLPVETIAELVLGDVLVHGFDLSRATKRDWTISRADALRVMAGIVVVAPHFVDVENARDFRGAFQIRLRGGPAYTFAFDHGTLTVAGDPTARADCRISADPRTFLLTTYGRLTPVRAAATGGVIAYGRRPWLAFRLTSLLRNP
jgi:uncharacterized protein (TIGR03083 family)